MNHMTENVFFAPWNEPTEPDEEESYNELTCECGHEMPTSEAWHFTDSELNNRESILCDECKNGLIKQGYSINDFKPYL